MIMDDSLTLSLAIVSILAGVLLGNIYTYLHSLNEKLSQIKTDLAEIKGLVQNSRRR